MIEPEGRVWDIIGKRRWGYLFSLIVIIPGIVALFTSGINLGIDFTGGTLLDVRLGRTAAIEEILIRRALQKTRGNRTRAAELLEISHRALLYKIKDYRIADL